MRYHRKMIGAGKIDVKQEANEMGVVEVANTVVDPRTVMI